jgi:hypothetical protein
MGKYMDLSGLKFGRLLVLERSLDNPQTQRDGQPRWKCQCDCGNTTYVLPYLLTSGRTKSCGCGVGENLKTYNVVKDLTGMKFGRLTVIRRVEDIIWKSGGKSPQWECQCECGNIVIKKSQDLTSGKSKSCGCLRNEIGNQPFLFTEGQTIKTKYSEFRVLQKYRIKRTCGDILDKKYLCQCTSCEEKQDILEYTLNAGLGSCRGCSDVKSYPAKYVYWFLRQIDVDFQAEYSPEWSGRYRFDFYFCLDGKEYIVEVDGAQHYTHAHKRLTVEEVKEIDMLKESLANAHGVSVIRLDCRESKRKMVETAIKDSNLSILFDLSNIDWKKCALKAISNKYRLFCDLWNAGNNTTQISQITGAHANYISKCLKECASIDLCEYDPQKESYRGSLQSTNGKQIRCIQTGETFNSAQECSKVSEEKFGVFLKGSGITRVCRKERSNYKGYSFEYI